MKEYSGFCLLHFKFRDIVKWNYDIWLWKGIYLYPLPGFSPSGSDGIINFISRSGEINTDGEGPPSPPFSEMSHCLTWMNTHHTLVPCEYQWMYLHSSQLREDALWGKDRSKPLEFEDVLQQEVVHCWDPELHVWHYETQSQSKVSISKGESA